MWWFCFESFILFDFKEFFLLLLTELLIGEIVCLQQIYELKEIDFVILVYSLGAACLELGGHEV